MGFVCLSVKFFMGLDVKVFIVWNKGFFLDEMWGDFLLYCLWYMNVSLEE